MRIDSNIAIENLANAIKFVRRNRKAQVTKIVELEKKLEFIDKMNDRLFKFEKGFDDKKCETDKTNIDNEIEKISQINKVIDEHTNVIASLEVHYTQVSVKLKEFEDSIKTFDQEIRTLKENNLKKGREEIRINTKQRLDKIKVKHYVY